MNNNYYENPCQNVNTNTPLNVKQDSTNKVQLGYRGFKAISIISFVLSFVGLLFAFFFVILPADTFLVNYILALAMLFCTSALSYGILCLAKRVAFGRSLTTVILSGVCIFAMLIVILLPKITDPFGLSDSQSFMTEEERTKYILENEVQVEFGEFTATEIYDDYYNTYLEIKISNITDKEISSVRIVVEAISEDGRRIDTESLYVFDLRAGNYVIEKAFTFIDSEDIRDMKNAKFEISDITVSYKKG